MQPTTERDAFEVLKGGVMPLSSWQRRLISIFIEYLYDLPEWDEKNGWERGSPYYSLINPIISAVFRKRYGVFRTVNELPPEAEQEFRELLRNARTRRNPVSERRKKMLEAANWKRSALKAVKYYQEARAEAGLGPDPLPEIENMTAERG